MKVMITGGSGFIGTQLTRLALEQGHEVSIFDLRRSETFGDRTVIGDVRDKGALQEAMRGCEVVYNLAAEHSDNVRPVSLYYDVNVGGAQNVVDAAEANGVKRLVFTSTAAVYGLNKGMVTEETVPDPFNDYGKSKYQGEKVFEAWRERGQGRTLTILRPTVIFGEGNRGNVHNLLKQIAEGPFLMIGTGRNQKSLGYVQNIALFLSTLVAAEEGSAVYNYADLPDLSMAELVSIANEALGRPAKAAMHVPYWLGLVGGYFCDVLSFVSGKELPVSSIRIKKFCEHTQVCPDRVRQNGFKAPYSLADAIRRTITYEFGNTSADARA